MFDNMNPATKQYWIFSAIIAILLSALINFLLIEFLKGSFAYGFPMTLNNVTGIANFIARIVNTIVQGAILVPLIFYLVKYLQTVRI